MKNIAQIVVWVVLSSFLASHALARAGVTVVRDRCSMRIGPYLMNYTGYQPEAEARGPFCVDLPAAGRTLIVLDVEQDSGGMSFVSDHYNELRDMTIDFRILRNVGQAEDDEDLEENTEAYLAARKYPAGTLQFEHNFPRTGHFIGVVSARDSHGRVFVLRFPFVVGPTPGGLLYVVGGLLLAAVAAAGSFAALRSSVKAPDAVFAGKTRLSRARRNPQRD